MLSTQITEKHSWLFNIANGFRAFTFAVRVAYLNCPGELTEEFKRPNSMYEHVECGICVFLYCTMNVWMASGNLHENRSHTFRIKSTKIFVWHSYFFYLHSSQRESNQTKVRFSTASVTHCLSFLIDRLRKTHYHFSLFGLFGFGEAFASKQINRFERLLCTLTLFPLIMSRCVSGFRFADVLLFRRFRIAYHSMLIGCIEISLEINAFVVLCILWSVICAFIYSMQKWCANIHTHTHTLHTAFIFLEWH